VRLSPPRTHHLQIASKPMNHAHSSAATHFFNSLIDFQFESADDFVNWWREQPAECAYCQTPIVLVKKLIEAGRLTVRKVKGEGVRGPVLELDRMDPKRPYSRLNCALACYCCNNDKSYIYDAKTYREYFGPSRNRHFRDLEAQVDKELKEPDQ
ncbi:hypothetical protein, partial [Nitrobacter sp.]|uniref:hypothetical protein n=1 Tax=Nitrobacter sp. TaxID=29420 RepID=UPI00321FAD9A